MDGPWELPKGWGWIQLGEVTDIVCGGTPPRGESRFWHQGTVPWATPTEIDPHVIRTITDTREHVTNIALGKKSARLLPHGTVLFSSRASIGKVAIAGKQLTTNQGFANLIPRDGVDSLYLAYYLRHSTGEIEKLASGTTYLEVAKSSLKNFPFPLAPLAEQRRIVAKIETLFANIRTTREALERLPELMQRFRRAVRGKAFRGTLAAGNPSDEPANLLLERMRRIRRNMGGEHLGTEGEVPTKQGYEVLEGLGDDRLWELPNGWKWTPLGEVVEFLDRLRVPVNDSERQKRIAGKRREQLFPYYGANGQVGWIDDFIFDEKLILLAEDGGFFDDPLKPVAYIAEGKCWVNNHAHVLRPLEGVVQEYVVHVLNMLDLMPHVSGSTRLKLTQGAAQKIPIPLPGSVEQRRIITAIEGLFAQVSAIEAAAQAARKWLDRLDEEVLKRAFQGDLVEQDSNDEPATVLLERIWARGQKRQSRPRPKVRAPKAELG